MTLTNGRNSTMKFVPDVSYNHDLSLSPPPPLSLSLYFSSFFSLSVSLCPSRFHIHKEIFKKKVRYALARSYVIFVFT